VVAEEMLSENGSCCSALRLYGLLALAIEILCTFCTLEVIWWSRLAIGQPCLLSSHPPPEYRNHDRPSGDLQTLEDHDRYLDLLCSAKSMPAKIVVLKGTPIAGPFAGTV